MLKSLVFLVVAVSLVGCATAGSDILPRVVAGLEAAKSVQAAVCHPVPKGAEKLCSDLEALIERYDAVRAEALKVAEEALKPVESK